MRIDERFLRRLAHGRVFVGGHRVGGPQGLRVIADRFPIIGLGTGSDQIALQTQGPGLQVRLLRAHFNGLLRFLDGVAEAAHLA